MKESVKNRVEFVVSGTVIQGPESIEIGKIDPIQRSQSLFSVKVTLSIF